MNPSDLIISPPSFDAPSMTIGLVAVGVEIAPQPPFDILTISSPELAAAELVQWPPKRIILETPKIAGGHAIPIEQLLEQEFDQDEDDAEALAVATLLLAARQRRAAAAAIVKAFLALEQ